MQDGRTFADGFIAGWHSVIGAGAPMPAIPSAPVSDKPPYLHGISMGVGAALKAKAQMKIDSNRSHPHQIQEPRPD
jgi:hypothetical protein